MNIIADGNMMLKEGTELNIIADGNMMHTENYGCGCLGNMMHTENYGRGCLSNMMHTENYGCGCLGNMMLKEGSYILPVKEIRLPLSPHQSPLYMCAPPTSISGFAPIM